MLSECDRVIATSFSMPELLMPFNLEKFNTITNGYDSTDFLESKEVKPRQSEIVFYHAGLLNELRNQSSCGRL